MRSGSQWDSWVQPQRISPPVVSMHTGCAGVSQASPQSEQFSSVPSWVSQPGLCWLQSP
jgi:hypothetical protein